MIQIDLTENRLNGQTWMLRAEIIRMTECGWEAILGIRTGLKLLVQFVDGETWIEAWVDAPEDSDGVAVIGSLDTPRGLAPIPLCGCGDRGCGNSGRQFAKELDPDLLPELILALRDLPWIAIAPTREMVLRGTSIIGLPKLELPRGRYKVASRFGEKYHSFEVLADGTTRDRD